MPQLVETILKTHVAGPGTHYALSSSRISAAVNLLAEAVGCSSSVTFTRNFRRCAGMSPSEYREISKA